MQSIYPPVKKRAKRRDKRSDGEWFCRVPRAGDRHDAPGPALPRLGPDGQEVLEERQQQDRPLLVRGYNVVK